MPFGYEVGTCAPAAVPVRNMVITGQTQEAGKTTTLEALIARSGRRAIAFVTKRHEKSFTSGRLVRPYFRERADWRFVASVLEATMQEKFKYERPWIMKVCRGASTLADVHQNIRAAMKKLREGTTNHNAYSMLDEYLQIVVPAMSGVQWAESVDLAPGLNVMDLRDLPAEAHGLVIGATVEWIYRNESDVITVVPEAWKFLPQQRSSPVKLAVEHLVREGSAGGNYVWLDSQDIAAVDKAILKSFIVWMLGVQREANEVKRVLAHMSGMKKPKADDVMQLGLGQFYLSYGSTLVKAYAQPAWMSDGDARRVAAGTTPMCSVRQPPPVAIQRVRLPRKAENDDARLPELLTDDYFDEEGEDDVVDAKQLGAEVARELKPLFDQLLSRVGAPGVPAAPKPNGRRGHDGQTNYADPVTGRPVAGVPDFVGAPEHTDVYEYIRQRLLSDPMVIEVLKQQKQIGVTVEVERVDLTNKTLLGRIALLLHGGFFKEPQKNGDVLKKLAQIGAASRADRVGEALSELTGWGYLTREAGEGFKEVAGMKAHLSRPGGNE